jgi:hypothetical protein
MECVECAFKCTKQSNLDRHNRTEKHLKGQKLLSCSECAKTYKTASGLWKHAKQCKQPADLVLRVLEENKDLRTLLLQQQDDHSKKQETLLAHLTQQQQQINELIPRIGNTTNRFNLNVFLNEECKDAVNWNDFIASLELQLDAEGFIKTICDGIQELGLHKRPIHCLDLKRKKLCLKTDDAWEHDSTKIQDTFRRTNGVLQQRYMSILKTWEDAHPHWYKSEAETEKYTNYVSVILAEMDEARCTSELSKNICLPKA